MDGEAIPGAPFTVKSEEPPKSGAARAYGPGLESGVAAVPTMFTIETGVDAPPEEQPEVYAEVQGPSMKFAPKIKPAGKGKYEVHYTPSEAGDHLITVIVGGEPVNGSPFKVPVKLNHAKKVRCNRSASCMTGVLTGVRTTGHRDRPGACERHGRFHTKCRCVRCACDARAAADAPAAGKQTEFLISNAPDEAVAKTVVTVTAPDKSKVPAKLESQARRRDCAPHAVAPRAGSQCECTPSAGCARAHTHARLAGAGWREVPRHVHAAGAGRP